MGYGLLYGGILLRELDRIGSRLKGGFVMLAYAGFAMLLSCLVAVASTALYRTVAIVFTAVAAVAAYEALAAVVLSSGPVPPENSSREDRQGADR